MSSKHIKVAKKRDLFMERRQGREVVGEVEFSGGKTRTCNVQALLLTVWF